MESAGALRQLALDAGNQLTIARVREVVPALSALVRVGGAVAFKTADAVRAPGGEVNLSGAREELTSLVRGGSAVAAGRAADAIRKLAGTRDLAPHISSALDAVDISVC